ncbi:hypothetical protein BD560DRAFT_404166 [Blakeslea trispora]|nr:hypothetical protein BD560DRAFT_404166 [Blakeslea trispora]
MIHSLPFEITQCISQYLSHNDYYQLLLVNHLFHDTFILFLYSDVSIHCRYNFAQFLKASRYHQYVHNMRMVQASLPYLQSLHVWISDHVFESNAATVLSFYRSFQHITSLSLRKPLTVDSLMDILSYHPKLETLSLFDLSGMNITAYLLESIHQHCPSLMHLTVEGAQATAPESTTQLHEPIQSIKVLKLRSCSGLDQPHSWLPYLGRLYPQLESLELKNHKKDRLSDTRGTTEPHDVGLYSRFWSDCPKLVHVDLCGVKIEPHFFQQLEQRQRCLHRLALCAVCGTCSSICHHLFSTGHLSTIQSISLGLPHNRTSHAIIQLIGQACPGLQHLRLNGSFFLTGTIDLDVVLLSFSRLTSLCLVQVNLCASPDQTQGIIEHPLRKIKLVQCVLPDDFFHPIATLCYHLESLTLNDVRLYPMQEIHHQYKIDICLPHQQLRKLKIGRRMRVKKAPYDKIVQLFHITQIQEEKDGWYYADAYRENPNNIPVLARPFQKIEAIDMQQLNAMFSVLELGNGQDTSLGEANEFHSLAQHGYVNFKCKSVDAVFLNKKRLII